jgi:CHASE3 domain sensor protein
VILSLLMPAFFAAILVVSSYMLMRRRGKTGRFLLSTAELKEKVARDLVPKPMWKRIVFSAAYFLFASEATYDAMTSQHHRGLHWGFAVLIWLCAIIIAASELQLSRRKQSALAHPDEQEAPPIIEG